jgi:alpha-tubulin suppressor-like RCC1 family protein
VGRLAGEVRGRLVACLMITAICVVPMAVSRSRASAVDPEDRIAAGAAFTCAIRGDDTVWCWGRNDQGQLGSSAHSSLNESLLPVRTAVFGDGAVAAPVKVVAGAEHACVLTSAGSVWCWGFNGWGQVGVNGGNQWDPVQVAVGGTVTQLAAGGSNTCAVLSNNSVRCWGQNNASQLGNGTTDTSAHYVPEEVSGIPTSFTVASIDVGTGHVCASSTTGEAWCWGSFARGRLGTTATSNATTPARTEALGGIAADISTGAEHTCVVVGAGLVCFGRNQSGQSGRSTTTTQFSTPTAVTISGTVSRVSAGSAFTCIMLNTGAVQCFGSNASGQLGRGDTIALDAVPAAVQGLSTGAVAITAGASHACAITPAADVMCWGLNDDGQLGDNSQDSSNVPVAVPFFYALPTTTTTTTTTTLATTTTMAATTTTELATTTTELATTTTEMPTTTIASTTTEMPTTTVASTTTTVTTPPLSATTNQEVATSPVTSTSNPVGALVGLTSVSAVKVLKIGRNRSVTAAKIASAVSLKIPKRSKGTMRISITRGTRYCTFVGSTVRGIRKGTCTITVVLIPKKAKPTVKTLTIRVL